MRAPLGFAQGFLRGLLTHSGSFFLDEADYKVRASTNLNLYAGLRDEDGRWELSVFARNMFNAKGILGMGDGGLQAATRYLQPPPAGTPPSPPFRSGYRTVSTRLPRELGLTLSFNF